MQNLRQTQCSNLFILGFNINPNKFKIELKSHMKILNLIIKQVFFDQIIEGTKKQEFREIKPTTAKKYIQIDENNYFVEDENGNCVPLHYDAIQFYVGYNKDRDSALVEVTGAYTQFIVDENDEPLKYKLDNGDDFFVEEIVYNLGKVLEKKTKKQTNSQTL